MITELFDGFLQKRNIRLSKTQQKVAALLLDAAESDEQVMYFMTRPAQGATFFFELLDAFFSSRKIIPTKYEVMTDEEWRTHYDALIRRANQIGI